MADLGGRRGIPRGVGDVALAADPDHAVAKLAGLILVVRIRPHHLRVQTLDQVEVEDLVATLHRVRQQTVQELRIVSDLPHLGPTVLVGILDDEELV